MILLDTSILIDYYRKTDKSNSIWLSLIRSGYTFSISSISKYELLTGAKPNQLDFWNEVLKEIAVIPFDESCVDTAITINQNLKRKRKQIDIADLFIASTAVANNLSISTLNIKHFERIEELTLIK